MFNQGHQQSQHHMMNGGPASRSYAAQLNLVQNFKNQQLHHQHQQQHQGHHNPQHHDASSQSHGQHGHQHTFSSGGIGNSTPHYGQNNLPNGAQSGGPGGMGKLSEHWQHQLQLASESRRASSPHHHARANAHDNKGVTTGTANGQGRDGEVERNRASNSDASIRRQDWMSLDFGGQGLRALSTALFDYTFLDKLYLNFNKLAHLPSAIGRLKNLSHLDLSNNQISEVPPEMGMLVNLKTLFLFDNNLHCLPYEMGSLYQLETLGVEGNPLEEELRSEIVQNGTKALITHLREAIPVTLPPSQRDWIVLDEAAPSSASAQQRFSVLSYNTLCDKYATHSQYGYTPSLALSWDYRKELILQEVRGQNADIVCLQEIDTDSYNEYFRMQLAYNDYKGVFWPKTRAKTMAEKEAKAVDGCATFYKGSKYILLDKQIVDFANTAINRPDMKATTDVFNRVMPRDNIAVISFLEDRLMGTRIIVVNVHIHWDPTFRDVKLVQVAILMEQVAKLADKYAKWPACIDKTAFKLSEDRLDADGNALEEQAPTPSPSVEYAHGSQIPLVLCGDFNSTGDSGVYDLLSQGSVPNTHSDLGGYLYGAFTRDGMSHPFSLKSSYANIGELSFTNYTPGFTGVIDYIWYSTNNLQVTGLLGEVDKEYLQRVPGFPNYHFPSDHLALLTEFSVKGRKEKKTLPEVDFGPRKERRDQK
ncbi:MAG: Glucose-repressible alcohol dehydrogenase transcriptional effector [Piccolia ochrophora]|nr:MAG: Glucose-repressible alcohol dehydrogenase transcriptional effector [Piccolia ochrophora]